MKKPKNTILELKKELAEKKSQIKHMHKQLKRKDRIIDQILQAKQLVTNMNSAISRMLAIYKERKDRDIESLEIRDLYDRFRVLEADILEDAKDKGLYD